LKKSWILFVASRYIFKGRSSSPVLSILGIAIGVMALIIIIAVMNGFQLGFIESIIEISSYHIRVENFNEEKAEEIQNIILSVPGVAAAVPFKEFQALARGNRSGQQAVVVRGLNENTLELDNDMKNKLDFEEGFFNLSSGRNVLLGAELAVRMGLYIGDVINLYSITGLFSSSSDEGSQNNYVVTGIFRSGYYEYDYSWIFLNINNISFLENESDLKMGIKIKNRFHDKYMLEQIRKKLTGYEYIKLSSWREYNRSFFGALRTEKLFMFILVGLIFIVVGLNIFQAQRRSVLHRSDEIGLLRAVGGNEKAVQLIFIIDGAVIGLAGAVIGLIIGLTIALNIQQVFSFIEYIVNSFLGIIQSLLVGLGYEFSGDFKVFSTKIFYIKETPSRILPLEVLFIFIFGFLSALVAGWIASRKIAKIQPAEVLRYE